MSNTYKWNKTNSNCFHSNYPPVGKNVLIYINDENEMSGIKIAHREDYTDSFRCTDGSITESDRVTYWTELPSPPRKENDE